MTVKQTPLGHGIIQWLGINVAGQDFSQPHDTVCIHGDGIVGDKYRGMWRNIDGHDGHYMYNDNVERDASVINHRQITIVSVSEIELASRLSRVPIHPGMLRENIIVTFIPEEAGMPFSKLPPASRMVIGATAPKVLWLMEENWPCNTIATPIASASGNVRQKARVQDALGNRRGQLAMVRTATPRDVHVSTPFVILPPIRYPES